MLIKLTNAVEEHKGNTLLINPRHIMTVFETVVEVPSKDVKKKNKTVETITNVYSITQQSWTVKESAEDIYKMIQANDQR
jgi:hypothetical protein